MRLTTHSTGAESAWLSFARSDAWFVVSRPVNSSVRCLASQQATEVIREYLIRQLDDEEFSIPYAKWGAEFPLVSGNVLNNVLLSEQISYKHY
jgi:hypothetical protein